MVRRYSTRREAIGASLLTNKLKNAMSYDRIAGYFSSSILEVAGEALEQLQGKARVICNSGLDIKDVETARIAQSAMRREWCDFKPEEIPDSSNRFKRLYELLSSGKLEVKVVPDEKFGLIHGKAGVITLENVKKTSFLGSANETYNGWKLNYELVWEDDSEEAVAWVQEEFDALWNDPCAVMLSDFVIEDIKRISDRKVISTVKEWKEEPDPASTVIESPVYRKEFGLWEHQKYFVDLAFRDHKKSHGARYILADQVGLGKTIQLAMSAQLMALYGEKPILVIVPKTLLWQWQDELKTLLKIPSAVWNGKEWVDENGFNYPNRGNEDVKKCPRKIGIISQGLIVSKSPIIEHLLSREYECVIVDEAHRARRKNLGEKKELQSPEPNNLYEFLLSLSIRTKSMLLATATPIQLYPIELWDLLNILSQKNDSVLGSRFSMWRKREQIPRSLKLIMGEEKMDFFNIENWDWIRNPFPPSREDEMNFGMIRRKLGLKDDQFVINTNYLDLSKPDQSKIGRILDNDFYQRYNPYIRQVVRRERSYLEKTINPENGEPYLKRITVELHGETDEDALVLSSYLKQAYMYAEEFCNLLGKRNKSSGFLKTLLLKRIGSSIVAGLNTGRKMLNEWNTSYSEWSEEEDEQYVEEDIKNLTPEEEDLLVKYVKSLEMNDALDPKFEKVVELLADWKWLDKGCIIFSQYFDTARWFAEQLSVKFPGESVGLYAGGEKSGVFLDGSFTKKVKEELKSLVKQRKLRILLGTDSASEGLNLQTLGTLINLDLPWNPTRLEQRKGRIQRIGQINDEVHIFNLRYKDSVEDRVHSILSERFKNIHGVFGQLPDVLEDVWVDMAQNDIEKAKQRINEIPQKHPFENRYNNKVEKIDWESCSKVLDRKEMRKYFEQGW
ncbi:DEAD/DEAH box helicase family protein [Bacillus sp. ISL-4]|uniref:phospholipase D-like domain-containing anti-phage protein n=1 Tax=Bacillus sp. ISL-4 TaxID=2819125 RepID=UPI001BE9B76E|nr:phospholipase D-like domain-containing anti-phage protein [Bacillus sp. ISL-4]MBT2667304.1 DEAD/DEAH box helicase family protein [Bacillus sp. ISL-4]MBT2674180.1 DEAD/DEAH box helicase family protein [Streptomyces sp. ISL-14]